VKLELRYDCALAQLSEPLRARFLPLAEDEATRAFVAQALASRAGRLRTLGYRLLRRGLSDYDAYALLGMYAMHLVSAAQLRELIGDANPRRVRLLDVGAGDGSITALAAPLFAEVYATETSRVMRRRLRARGFRVLALDLGREPWPPELRADVVLCLNVLDRCSHPRSLLRALRSALAPGGKLVLSVPLPLRPHVQHAGATGDPDEPLPPAAPSFELGCERLANELIAAAGLAVERLSRAPYLCQGDATTPLYALDAAIFVCSAAI
jgi:SAM-dependent methyltransferase